MRGSLGLRHHDRLLLLRLALGLERRCGGGGSRLRTGLQQRLARRNRRGRTDLTLLISLLHLRLGLHWGRGRWAFERLGGTVD